jgi:hypothetical protein
MIGKGTFTFEVNGKTIGFKFGMLASAFTEKESGKSISDIFQGITEGKGDSTMSLLHYFYGAALAFAKSTKSEDPSIDDVSDWITEIGHRPALDMFQDSIKMPKAPDSPNLPLPEVSPGQSDSQ